MTFIKKNIPVYISFILTVLFICAVYFQLNEAEFRFYLSSDTFYIPSFFRDIIFDGSRNIRWTIPAATCFFPDFVLLFIVHFFTYNFIKAMFFTGILMNLLLVFSFYLLIKEAFTKISPLYISIGINLLLLFHFASLFASDFVFSFHLTITNYHMGAYIASLFCLYLAVRYMKTRKLYNLVIMIVIYILTFSSDFLTIFYLIIPLLTLNILFFKKEYRLQALYLLASNFLGFVLGFLLYRLVVISKAFSVLNVSNLTFNFNKIAESYSIMLQHHLFYLKTMDVRALIFVLCIISFMISTAILIRKLIIFFSTREIEKSELFELLYLILIVVQVIVLYNAPAINGVYLGHSIIRYNVYVFFILILNYGYLFYKLALFKKLSKYTYIFAVLLIVFYSYKGVRVISKTNMKQGAENLFGYYPDYVRKIDELCVQNNLKYGLAGYWQARFITMLSKQDVRVFQTYGDLQPYHHVVNQNWYYGTSDERTIPSSFQFIIPDELIDTLIYPKLENNIVDTLKSGEVTLIRVNPFTIERRTRNFVFAEE